MARGGERYRSERRYAGISVLSVRQQYKKTDHLDFSIEPSGNKPGGYRTVDRRRGQVLFGEERPSRL